MTDSTGRLDLPVVVVTGASSGIGRAIAQAFAENSARLVLAARGAEGLGTVAAECEATDGDVLVVPTDVSDPRAAEALAQAAIARFGHIDVWVNNVGVGAVGRFDEVPMEAHRRVIETNLVGHMNGAHAVLPHFRERKRGVLVNMISLGGYVSAPYASAYVASKFGLRGFGEAIRAELSNEPDIHVCDVFPTFVDTPAMGHAANYSGRSLKPPPPLVDPRRVAQAVVDVVASPRAVTSVGGVALPGRIAHALAPEWVGGVSRWLMDRAFERAEPAPVTDGNLHAPSKGSLAVEGGYRNVTARASAGAIGVLGVAAVLGLAWWHSSARRTAGRF